MEQHFLSQLNMSNSNNVELLNRVSTQFVCTPTFFENLTVSVRRCLCRIVVHEILQVEREMLIVSFTVSWISAQIIHSDEIVLEGWHIFLII